MSAGFRMIACFEVPAGSEAGFEAAWDAMAALARAHPSNLEQWLIRDTSAGTYAVVNDWVDATGFEDFQAGPDHHTAGAELKRHWTSVSVTKGEVLRHLLPDSTRAPA